MHWFAFLIMKSISIFQLVFVALYHFVYYWWSRINLLSFLHRQIHIILTSINAYVHNLIHFAAYHPKELSHSLWFTWTLLNHIYDLHDNCFSFILKKLLTILASPYLITFEVWIDPSSNASIIGNKTAVTTNDNFIKHFCYLFIS